MQPSEEIKQKINIADLISEYMPLKRAGVNFRAPCPFHQEKSPSFYVSPAKQIWHCFGCSLGGDIFEFIKQIEGVDFPEALRILAARAGVTLKKPSATYKAETDKKEVFYRVNELAAQFYSLVLEKSNSADRARKYLSTRGLGQGAIAKWRIGYSPQDSHVFENFIVKKGFQRKEALEAGLLGERDGQYFDRFRGRVMFPLFDLHGRIAGFTARALESGEGIAKYVNSPETLIYKKSQLIYGLHAAKNAIRKTNLAIIVEGNMDAITCHEFGFENTVASSGTAFTMDQLTTLKRFTDTIGIAFDTDAAGLAAMRRGVENALLLGFNVKIIAIPSHLAKDPDELIRKDAAAWSACVDQGQNFLDFYFERVFAKLNTNSSLDKKQAVSELLPLISLLPDPLDRTHYVQKLADGLSVEPKLILDLLNSKFSKTAESSRQRASRTVPRQPGKSEILERRVMGMLLKFPSELHSEWQSFQERDFTNPVCRQIFSHYQQTHGKSALGPQVSELQPDLKHEAEMLVFALENELDISGDWKLEDVKKQIFAELEQDITKRRLKELTLKIKQAEMSGSSENLKSLSAEFNNLIKKISNTNAESS